MDLGKTLKKYITGSTKLTTGNQAIFYVTLDPERALGLEDILPNYTIICPYTSQLTEKLQNGGIEILILEKMMPVKEVKEIVGRGTYGILKSAFIQRYIAVNVRGSTPHIMILKNSQLIENFCRKQGWKLLAPRAKVAEQFENKISQYKLLKNVVPYPKTTVSSQIANLTGTVPVKLNGGNSGHIPVVLQFNRGHSGNSTFFIKPKEDLAKLAEKFPNREAKISEYIKGKTYTLNCLVLKDGDVVTGSISRQITGLKSATNNPNTTCGNDFTSARKLPKKQVIQIQKTAQSTGMALFKKGYKGLFGIDVIIQSKGGKVYFIEVNTHQPASVSFEAKLHRKIGKMPLLAYFILNNFGDEVKIDKKNRPPIILSISARQVIYRNKTSKILTQKYIERIYGGKGLVSRMKLIKPNEEIYRKQYGI